MSVVDEYYKSLNRLVKNKSINVPKYTKITNDAVALEAGRKKGSIKKSREMFGELIQDIKLSAHNQSNPSKEPKIKLTRCRELKEKYKQMYEESLAREISLLNEVMNLKKQIKKA